MFKVILYTMKLKVQMACSTKTYKFRHWLFSWKDDGDRGLVFSIAQVIHFVKYKEHTIVELGKKDYDAAPKYVLE